MNGPLNFSAEALAQEASTLAQKLSAGLHTLPDVEDVHYGGAAVDWTRAVHLTRRLRTSVGELVERLSRLSPTRHLDLPEYARKVDFYVQMALDLPAGDTKVADTQQLPPVLSLQYHFNGTAGAGSVSPFLGVGVNYTTFFNTDTTGMLAGTDLDLGDSWGAAFHAGVDYKASEKDIVRVDVRYIDIETEAELDGQKLDDVAINPWVFGMSYVRMF